MTPKQKSVLNVFDKLKNSVQAGTLLADNSCQSYAQRLHVNKTTFSHSYYAIPVQKSNVTVLITP